MAPSHRKGDPHSWARICPWRPLALHYCAYVSRDQRLLGGGETRGGHLIPYCPGHARWTGCFSERPPNNLERLAPASLGHTPHPSSLVWGGRWVMSFLSLPQQALGPASPRRGVPAGSRQAESEVLQPGARQTGEELFSASERIFQVFFNRTHFLFINDSLCCGEKKKRGLFLEQITFLILSHFFLF